MEPWVFIVSLASKKQSVDCLLETSPIMIANRVLAIKVFHCIRNSLAYLDISGQVHNESLQNKQASIQNLNENVNTMDNFPPCF